jgi:S-adenosylmethionine decarboxylase
MASHEPSIGTYGQHLLVRLANVEHGGALDSPAAISVFLVSLVRQIDMRILHGPHTATAESGAIEYGHSGVVILYESHAAIHTYPHRRELFLDLFSCRPFSVDTVLAVCCQHFGAHTVSEFAILDRGHHWESGQLGDWMTSR